MQFIRVFATLLAFAAASSLASPLPVGALAKKETAGEFNILARDSESQGSELENLAREPEPETVGARNAEPCIARMCS